MLLNPRCWIWGNCWIQGCWIQTSQQASQLLTRCYWSWQGVTGDERVLLEMTGCYWGDWVLLEVTKNYWRGQGVTHGVRVWMDVTGSYWMLLGVIGGVLGVTGSDSVLNVWCYLRVGSRWWCRWKHIWGTEILHCTALQNNTLNNAKLNVLLRTALHHRLNWSSEDLPSEHHFKAREGEVAHRTVVKHLVLVLQGLDLWGGARLGQDKTD